MTFSVAVAIATALAAATPLSSATRTTADSTVVSPAPAGYPRLAMINNGTQAVGVVEKPDAQYRRLVFIVRTSIDPEAWAENTTIVEYPATPDVDLANGYMYQMPNGTLLCAYRHHDGNGANRVYRIATSMSDDFGLTWRLGGVISAGPVGVWEPMLYKWSGDASPDTVHVTYSAEITNGGEQDVVIQDSYDGGLTWGPVSARVHTQYSRNGMPGVSELRDHSLLMVHEGFQNAPNASNPNRWGHFTVNSARSFDGGKTWPQQQVIFDPCAGSDTTPSSSSSAALSSSSSAALSSSSSAAVGYPPCNGTVSWWDAGSPQVGVCAHTGKIAVVFMSNVPTSSSPPSTSGAAWPDGASIFAISAHLNYTANVSAPIDWSQGHPGVVPTEPDANQAYWPSMLLDPQVFSGGNKQQEQEHADVSAGIYDLRVVYQGGDGSAQVTTSTLCID